MTDLRASFDLRDYRDADAGAVFGPWTAQIAEVPPLRSYPSGLLAEHCARVLRPLVARSRVRLAVSPDDDDRIYGWVCVEEVAGRLVLHFVYVKSFARRRGIGGALMRLFFPDLGGKCISHTYETRCSGLSTYRKKWLLRHDPYLLALSTAAAKERP